MDKIIGMLAVCGGVALMIAGLLLIMFVHDWISDFIRESKRKYIIKHRFDKPPTAKCYCKDCTHHCDKTGRCYRFTEDRHTADNAFCWEAEPRRTIEEVK